MESWKEAYEKFFMDNEIHFDTRLIIMASFKAGWDARQTEIDVQIQTNIKLLESNVELYQEIDELRIKLNDENCALVESETREIKLEEEIEELKYQIITQGKEIKMLREMINND